MAENDGSKTDAIPGDFGFPTDPDASVEGFVPTADVPGPHGGARTLVIPRSAGLASWATVAALTTQPHFLEDISPTAAVLRAALGTDWVQDVPAHDREIVDETGAKRTRSVLDLERDRGCLFLGVGDGTGWAAVEMQAKSAKQLLDAVVNELKPFTAPPSTFVDGDPAARMLRYPQVPATPQMAVRALWLLADLGLLPAGEAEACSRYLGAVFLDAFLAGDIRTPADANLEALVARARTQKETWQYGKLILRATLATNAWLTQAATDWAAAGRTADVGLTGKDGVLRSVRIAVCSTASPFFTGWARGGGLPAGQAGVPGADIVVRVQNGGFFAQVVGDTLTRRKALATAVERWRVALADRPLTHEQQQEADRPGTLPWSPIFLDAEGAQAGNRHEGNPHGRALPYPAAALADRLLQVL